MAATGKVTNKIMRYIKQNIKNGTWQVGDRIISENQLCEELGVSRVSVRSAIQQFVSLGILEVKHGKGTFLISNDLSVFAPSTDAVVAEINSVSDMEQLLEFRAMIEPSICEKVAEDASPELIDRLSKILQTMRDSIGHTRAFVEADMQFHMELCYATGNPITIAIMSEIFHRKAASINMLNLANGYYGGIYYHSRLLEILKKHDSKKAYALMKEHLLHGIEELYEETEE